MNAVCLLTTALLLAAPAGAAKAPADAAPGPRDRCRACGMFVAKHPEWLASIRFRDGTVAWFDGPKDLMRFLHDPARFGAKPGEASSDVVAIRVTDYYSVTPIDAETAWYVAGSDVLGPMGRELVPFAREHEAVEFARDHGATTILRFEEISPAVLEALR